jgi:3-hydroxybutyryl-CoA dehydrogenase
MNIGVVGAGTIGIGVAQTLSEAGHRVILVDSSQDALDRASREIKQALRLQVLLKKSKAGGSLANSSPSLMEHTTRLEALTGVEFVVENVPEQWGAKRDVYRRLDVLCVPACIFAANTSCFSIERIASETTRPEQVVGMHFMNPVAFKDTVEVIRWRKTSEKTLQAACDLLATMQKRAIVVNDGPGFVTNRVLMLTINEAIFTVHEGIATAEQVDDIFRTCFGHKMGPLETADLIGLDTILFSIEVLQESFGDKYRPCPLLCDMVAGNRLGRKSGKGFYEYDSSHEC